MLGTFGLAALSPPAGAHPGGIVLGAIPLPVVLFELGASISQDARTPRAQLIGVRVEVLGACAYFVVCALALLVGTRHPDATAFGYPFALVGAILAARVLRVGRALLRGPLPVARLRRK